jgi:Flp pilus assembly protein TadD
MRHPILILLCTSSALALAGCNQGPTTAEAARAMQSVNVVDETNMNDIMLTVADPAEAINYFTNASAGNPDRIDLKRGLAKSLIRGKRATEGAAVWGQIANGPQGTDADRVDYADALIRANDWPAAKGVLNTIPPTYETFDRYRLEAMVADSEKNWKKADSFYETAIGLTTTPGNVLNNWGFSKLTRGDYAGAERLFTEAISYDPNLFTSKNNLVMARAAQHKYDLPVVTMSQTERAQLLYTAALAAIKQGDVSVGKSLLHDAVETSPAYFEAAQRSLDALEGTAAKG